MDLTADGTEGAIGGTGGRGGDDDEDEEGEDALTSSASAEVQRCLVVGRYPGSGRHRRRIRRAGIGDAVAVSVVVAVVVVVVVVVDMRCCEGGGEVTANGRDDERKSDDAATSRRLEAMTIRPAIVILRLIVLIVFEFIRQVSIVCVDFGSQISCAENASGGSQERYGFLRTSDIPLRRRGTDATVSSQEEERGMYLSYGIINRNQLVFGHLITTTVPGFD